MPTAKIEHQIFDAIRYSDNDSVVIRDYGIENMIATLVSAIRGDDINNKKLDIQVFFFYAKKLKLSAWLYAISC